MNDKKITIITIVSMMVSLLLITIGLSFAYFTANITNTENTATINVTGGKMNIHYSGGEDINALNINPKDTPFGIKTFTLTGNNTTEEDMRYHILLIIEENTFSENALSYKLISTNTDNNGEVAPSIEELTGIPTGNNQDIFLGNAHFTSPTEGNKVHTYSLELYFPDTGVPQDEDQGKAFNAYVDVREGNFYPEYNEEKGVNHPVLFTGMTPIKWDESNEEIETTKDDLDWYDYDEKRWANAKSLDGSYWVWIPRYAYKITTGYHSSDAGTIDVKFLKERTNETIDGTIIETEGYEPGVKDTSMQYFVHPGFQYNDGDLGFWMAKFEPSAHEGLTSGTENGTCGSDDVSTKSPMIVPNETSWRCINISNAYKVSLGMKENPIYGWNPTEVDSHMMTNHEWGAVAFLSASQFGAPSEVWNNSHVGFKTGCSGPNANASNSEVCVQYQTEKGQKASTTHNIYGVYDMSGGAWDRVMGNYNDLIASSGFEPEELSEITSNYITKYYTSSEELLNNIGVNYDFTLYGDAVYETSYNPNRYNGSSWEGGGSNSWHLDTSYLPTVPGGNWIIRGGCRSDSTMGGVFSFNQSDGAPSWPISFRPVLFPL